MWSHHIQQPNITEHFSFVLVVVDVGSDDDVLTQRSLYLRAYIQGHDITWLRSTKVQRKVAIMFLGWSSRSSLLLVPLNFKQLSLILSDRNQKLECERIFLIYCYTLKSKKEGKHFLKKKLRLMLKMLKL